MDLVLVETVKCVGKAAFQLLIGLVIKKVADPYIGPVADRIIETLQEVRRNGEQFLTDWYDQFRRTSGVFEEAIRIHGEEAVVKRVEFELEQWVQREEIPGALKEDIRGAARCIVALFRNPHCFDFWRSCINIGSDSVDLLVPFDFSSVAAWSQCNLVFIQHPFGGSLTTAYPNCAKAPVVASAATGDGKGLAWIDQAGNVGRINSEEPKLETLCRIPCAFNQGGIIGGAFSADGAHAICTARKVFHKKAYSICLRQELVTPECVMEADTLGRAIAIANCGSVCFLGLQDGTLQLLERNRRGHGFNWKPSTIRLQNAAVSSLALAANGTRLVSGTDCVIDTPHGSLTKGERPELAIWESNNMVQLAQTYVPDGIRSLAVSPTGHRIAAVTREGRLQFFSNRLNPLPYNLPPEVSISSVVFLGHDRIAVGTREGLVSFVDLT